MVLGWICTYHFIRYKVKSKITMIANMIVKAGETHGSRATLDINFQPISVSQPPFHPFLSGVPWLCKDREEAISC